jgi:hypothetical protein
MAYFKAEPGRSAGYTSTTTSAHGGNFMFPNTISGQFFISMWVKPSVLPSTSAQLPLLSFIRSPNTTATGTDWSGGTGVTNGTLIGASGSKMDGIHFGFDKGYMCLNIQGEDPINFADQTSEKIYKSVSTITSAMSNTQSWYHLYADWDGSVTTSAVRLYINGVSVPTTCRTGTAGSAYDLPQVLIMQNTLASPPPNAECRIGTGWVTSDYTDGGANVLYDLDETLHGTSQCEICDVYLGNTVLTSAQILQYANLPVVKLRSI